MYVYLNNAATTKTDGRVLFKMSKYYSELFENPMTSNYSPLAKMSKRKWKIQEKMLQNY